MFLNKLKAKGGEFGASSKKSLILKDKVEDRLWDDIEKESKQRELSDLLRKAETKVNKAKSDLWDGIDTVDR